MNLVSVATGGDNAMNKEPSKEIVEEALPSLMLELVQRALMPKSTSWWEKVMTAAVGTAVGALVVGFFILLYNGLMTNEKAITEQGKLIQQSLDDTKLIRDVVINNVSEVKADVTAIKTTIDTANMKISELETKIVLLQNTSNTDSEPQPIPVPSPAAMLDGKTSEMAIQDRRNDVERQKNIMRSAIQANQR